MTINQLQQLLQQLRSLPAETESVEFKTASNQYDFGKIGKYFSAISNEANLTGKSCGWLVFGIRDDGRAIVGSSFRTNRADLDSLKSEIANKTTNRITFIEIHELFLPEGRVVMFQIPAAPRGFPVAWEGHYYGREGGELAPLNLEEIERIRTQALREDWSAAIIPEATLNDLDPEALAVARRNYKQKFPDTAAEVDGWDDITFLNKAKVTLRGQITRAAIILLGKTESEHLLSPSVAKIRWILKGPQTDYLVESCPFLLAVEKIYAKIRNVTHRRIVGNTLFPEEMPTYEPFTIREAINNCIAHQDYTLCGYINVVETPDALIFSNLGSFIPGSVEKVVIENAPTEHYRNRFLANAMFNLRMVDTIGGGIHKMFLFQKDRFFPMPEYLLSADRVELTIAGKVLNMDYARALAENKELSLTDILLLDKVQKQNLLTDDEIKHLKTKRLVEGKKPNFHIAATAIVSLSDNSIKAQYIKQKGFDDQHYKRMILEYIQTFGSASRAEIDSLLMDKLPDVLSEQQKKFKIGNLLSLLRRSGKIINSGPTKISKWALTNK